LARGSAKPVTAGEVALRLIQTSGVSTGVVVGSSVGSVSELRQADLLETPSGDLDLVELSGYQIATVLARLDVPQLLDTDALAAVTQAEVAQPLYARYWQHNRGPAPLGGLAAVAHLHPQQVCADPGEEVALRLTMASDCSDARLDGTVTLVYPPGWSATPGEVPFSLPSRQHHEVELAVPVPAGAGPGWYPVRAQLRLTGGDLPPAWRQVVEDVCLVSVGSTEDDSGMEEVLYLVDGPSDIELAAGHTAQLTVTVGTDACAELALEAHLISPWGTWEWIGPAACGAVLSARSTVELSFDVAPPVWQEAGEWWALVRVGCAGRLVYTPAVKVTVR
jgi:alpha-mannosidase